MVEERRVGGTCLHRGCIPAKELLQTAEVLRTVARRGRVRRADRRRPTLELAESRRSASRRSSTGSRRARVAAEGAQGHGRSPAPARSRPTAARSRVSDGTEVRGRNVLIATGSAPRELPSPGFDVRRHAGAVVRRRAAARRGARRASRSSAAARSAASSRRSSSTSAPRSRSSRRCRRSWRASTSRSRRRSCARSRSAASRCRPACSVLGFDGDVRARASRARTARSSSRSTRSS